MASPKCFRALSRLLERSDVCRTPLLSRPCSASPSPLTRWGGKLLSGSDEDTSTARSLIPVQVTDSPFNLAPGNYRAGLATLSVMFVPSARD